MTKTKKLPRDLTQGRERKFAFPTEEKCFCLCLAHWNLELGIWNLSLTAAHN
jgi:hypothetical protein